MMGWPDRGLQVPGPGGAAPGGGVAVALSAEPRAIRSWLGLLFLMAAYFAFNPLEAAIWRPLAHRLGLRMIVDGMMGLQPYAVLMVVRLALDVAVVAGVRAILPRRGDGFPFRGPRRTALALGGLATGLAVMTAAIAGIIATGHATASVAAGSAASRLASGGGWLAADLVGAVGEELYARVAVLLVAERLLGWRGALLVSGLMFAALHLGNPGVTWLWLLRLSVQGVLLAYAVYRTGSFWWSAGYHAGWNWASAPLFGAAGSGFLDRGHLLDFTPAGTAWISGGPVGPEGSVLAFVAMLGAFGLLLATTPARSPNPARPERAGS